MRPGAGRPKGSISRRVRAINNMTVAALSRVKKVPLETMLKNMERFDDEADGLYSKLSSMIENGKPSSKAPRKEHLEFFDKVMSLIGKMRECRLDAQRCATDAAPYMHQRLAAVQVSVSNDTIKAKPEHEMSADELAEYYNKLRMRPTSVNPLVIDNESGESALR
ncbi:hypothetical protein V1281_005490 [Nitrobacteraceae bacterium AZCC 2161]